MFVSQETKGKHRSKCWRNSKIHVSTGTGIEQVSVPPM